ncbi:glucosamine-6-phosphate deaminase [Paracoccus sp. (in: a-proteobacteria)]|uniref:glucosamine-6-phosphate deaminase n=1 Tax=Paracoccus sp. TaxID=267 RepID=UPI003A8A7B58
MDIVVHPDKHSLGAAAASQGAEAIRKAVLRNGRAAIIVATGASQFEMLDHLVNADIDWSKVTAFHLDEYVGLDENHPASFRRYLRERFVARVGDLGEFVAVNGSAPDLVSELARLSERIGQHRIDVCFAGFGENCHLAFNDPPADFDTEAPYIAVDLDEACRRQQMGEGWFPTLADVPARAISMSIRQILKSERLILAVPDARKAQAVRDAVEGSVTNLHPASVVQRHKACSLHLDPASATLLSGHGRTDG